MTSHKQIIVVAEENERENERKETMTSAMTVIAQTDNKRKETLTSAMPVISEADIEADNLLDEWVTRTK